MSPETKELLKTTWAKVIPISDIAAGLFYERLFTLDPSLQRLFKNADMKEQRRKLVQALSAVINSVDDLPSLIPTLEILGRNHIRYGVEDRHYETVGAALLWTLEQGLKEAWTPAAKSAWVVAYSTVSGVMRQPHRERTRPCRQFEPGMSPLGTNGHAAMVASCPFTGVEQTSGGYGAMSACDPIVLQKSKTERRRKSRKC
jgi:hemoglobin-like flavoprotein